MSRGTILVADDEVLLTNSLTRVLTAFGYDVSVCNDGVEFLDRLETIRPDAILLDVYFGDVNGLKLLRELKERENRTPVIMITAHVEVPLAVEAMREGATDFITKPFDMNHLQLVIERTLERQQLEQKLRALQAEVADQRSRGGIIGSSTGIRKALELAQRLARSETTTVLLEGQSGTGKEMFARYLHDHSPRQNGPFITVNCGAIPKDLAESELFGYEKGAFTGATEKMKQGKFELAHQGTILLDEVGELSLDMQVKLLRVLEEKRLYRLGGTKLIDVDVRILAATNRDLAREVEAGRFREDLFYRLNVAVLRIPPLKERTEDIPQLAAAFLKEFAEKLNRPVPALSPEAEQLLKQQQWRGNVRELRNVIERVLLITEAQTLTERHFSFLQTNGSTTTPSGENSRFTLSIPPKGVPMNDVLRELILKTLAMTGGNQVQAAKVLGITRSKLRYRMDQLGIHPEERGFKITTPLS